MEIKNILLATLVVFTSCISNSQKRQTQQENVISEIVEKDSIKSIQDSINQVQINKPKASEENISYNKEKILFNKIGVGEFTQSRTLHFEDNTVAELPFNPDSFYIELSINNLLFESTHTLESANAYLWLYDHNKSDKILLIEGDDYYASVFFVYRFVNEQLYYLGDFFQEFPLVEDTGTTKDISVQMKDNKLYVNAIWNKVEEKTYEFLLDGKKLNKLN